MKASALKLTVCIGIAAVLVASCNRNAAIKSDVKPHTPVASTEAAPPTRTSLRPVYADSAPVTGQVEDIAVVNSVALRRSANAPSTLVIRASGIVPSGGWTNPVLVPIEDTHPDATTKSFKFVAAPPSYTDRSSARAIYVQLRMDDVPAGLRTIRILSGTNSASATLAEPVKINASRPTSRARMVR